MASEKRAAFVNVDQLVPQVTLEQVAAYYGVQLPELKRIGAETRAACFLNCGRTCETGDRALAIQMDHAAKQWACHQYGCGRSGNLISMMDLLKPGQTGGGRPRGDRFKGIAADLRAIVEGAPAPAAAQPRPQTAALQPPKLNVPLAQSDNERARGLVSLDSKFITDVSTMPPAASAYFRRRPFLTSEACKNWRVGYLPRDTGENKSGGTIRGRIVYGYLSEQGEVLTWFGRDPEFEKKHQLWQAAGRTDREPEKFHFVKGFHRGLELFGQHALRRPEATEKLRQLGLVLVEGPNDVMALDALGVPAVAACSNTLTDEQADKAARLARELANGVVTLMFDCDSEGQKGAEQALMRLAERTPVRLAWSGRMFGGKFKGRQPESLTANELGGITNRHVDR